MQLLTSFIQLDLIRFIAHQRPIIAASRAVQRISCIIGDASAITKYPKVESFMYYSQSVMDSICLFFP